MAIDDYTLVSEDGLVVMSAENVRVAPPATGELALDLYGSEEAVEEYAFEYGAPLLEPGGSGVALEDLPNHMLINTWSGDVFKTDVGWSLVAAEGSEKFPAVVETNDKQPPAEVTDEGLLPPFTEVPDEPDSDDSSLTR